MNRNWRSSRCKRGWTNRTWDFRKYWQPWILPYSSMRTLPEFKQILVDGGIVDYWRTTGKWGDFCKPVGDDDFQCR